VETEKPFGRRLPLRFEARKDLFTFYVMLRFARAGGETFSKLNAILWHTSMQIEHRVCLFPSTLTSVRAKLVMLSEYHLIASRSLPCCWKSFPILLYQLT